MLILCGETNFFTVSEPKEPTKPTSQWLWEFNRHSSPKVFRESRFSENSNMYSRTKVLYVPLWKCWLLLGKTNFCVVPEPIKPIKPTFQRLSVFSPPSSSNTSSVNPQSLQKVGFIGFFGSGCVNKLVFPICEFPHLGKHHFGETLSFQPTIHFKHVQHKSPKSVKCWFYWFCWFGICEKVGFHYITSNIQ